MVNKQSWERLVNKQERLKDELKMSFELNEKELFNEILELERELVLLEN